MEIVEIIEKINNPFLMKGYAGKALFCDRVHELRILYQNVSNGIDTTLISPRIGKTGLIYRFFDYLKEMEWGESHDKSDTIAGR